MKKNYFSTFFAALMLLVAMPATAQVSGMSDLLGKYQFSATITPTEDGQSFTDWWVSECEVTIDSETILDDNNQVVETSTSINGFLGATQRLLAGRLDTDKCEFYVGEPNPGYGLLDPYNGVGIADPKLEMKDFTLTLKYDPQTKEITIPDFSIYLLTFNNNEFTKGKELAKVTNAKLTFAGEFTVADLSGDWHFVAGEGEYDTMGGSTLPTEWDMKLTATDEYNKAYDVDFVLGDFAPLALTATFDGQKLLVAFDNAYLDVENMISLGDYNSAAAASEFEFILSSENELSLNYGMCIVGEVPSFSTLQYYGAGVATRSAAEEEEAFDWVGTYTVTVGEIVVENDDYTYPKTFEMEIVYDEYWKEWYITKFFGQDVTFNYYGCGLFVTPTDNKAEINLSYGNGLVNFGDGTYLGMFDSNGNANTLSLEEENGVVKFDDFKVMFYAYESAPEFLAATYKNVTAVKKGSEGETGIENTIVENNTVEGIFDLLGRKLDAITAPGLYIVNGKKVVIK